jgi:phage baseplate assembly protein W
MPDLFQQFGSDLSIGPTGDLALASGTTLVQQRVLRRVLTNPGDYIWQPGYGARLARYVGQPTNPLQIRATIRSQIFQEPSVARTPEPVIDVEADDTGTIYVSIRYADATTGETQILSFSVGSAA